MKSDSAHFYEALFHETHQVGIVILDRDGHLVRWNRAAHNRLGYTEREFLELGIVGIDIDEDEVAYSTHIQHVLEQGHDKFYARHLKKDNTIMHVEVNAQAVKVNGDLYIQSIWVDRTLAHQHESELKAKRQEALELAYSLAHDIGASVRRTKRIANQLVSAEHRNALLDACKQVEILLIDLQEYAKTGKWANNQGPLVLTDIIAQALGSMHDDFRYADVRVDPLPLVIGNIPGLVRLFINLFQNALTYNASDKPAVHVYASPAEQAGWHTISVQDNGVGIDSRFHDTIFKPGCRLWSWYEYPGTGLGLTICKRVVEAHGGRIWLESGESGTTFHFTLQGVSA